MTEQFVAAKRVVHAPRDILQNRCLSRVLPKIVRCTEQMAMKASEYKARRGLFDPTRPFPRESDG
jgi:hypothetical protein